MATEAPAPAPVAAVFSPSHHGCRSTHVRSSKLQAWMYGSRKVSFLPGWSELQIPSGPLEPAISSSSPPSPPPPGITSSPSASSAPSDRPTAKGDRAWRKQNCTAMCTSSSLPILLPRGGWMKASARLLSSAGDDELLPPPLLASRCRGASAGQGPGHRHDARSHVQCRRHRHGPEQGPQDRQRQPHGPDAQNMYIWMEHGTRAAPMGPAPPNPGPTPVMLTMEEFLTRDDDETPGSGQASNTPSDGTPASRSPVTPVHNPGGGAGAGGGSTSSRGSPLF